MLDVHPPHAPTHTWRDFLIHIATICIGLLIAVGLEQSVEYVHHRRQVAEAHEALRSEMEDNIKRFNLEARSIEYTVPLLRGDLATFVYLREHPGAPADRWPSPIHGLQFNLLYAQGAWKSIQQSGVIEHLPAAEITYYDRLYTRLSMLTEIESQKRDAADDVYMAFAAQADASKMTAVDIDKEIHSLEVLLALSARVALHQRQLSRYMPAFKNPPPVELSSQGVLLHWPGAEKVDPQWQAIAEEYTKIEQKHEDDFLRASKAAQ